MPAKPPEPPIALPVAKQRAIREAFRKARVSDDVAGAFLRLISGHLASVEQMDHDYQETRVAIKALLIDRRSKQHLREARKALQGALGHLEAVEPVPPLEAPRMESAVEAARRALSLLDAMQCLMARVAKRPGPVPDLYQRMGLESIAEFFRSLGLRPRTTPKGLFVTVARILLKRTTDDDFSPREIMTAIRKPSAEKR